MLTTRLVKIAMVGSTALFALLATLNNLTDYDSNYQFVRHTLSMDTTFPGNALMYRAITNPMVWTLAYWLIILAEGLTGLALAAGAVEMSRNLHADGARFNASKRLAIIGIGIGFMVWFTGFMAIAGEWFVMWQSKTWNGQEPAFRFYMTLLGIAVFVSMDDTEPKR